MGALMETGSSQKGEKTFPDIWQTFLKYRKASVCLPKKPQRKLFLYYFCCMFIFLRPSLDISKATSFFIKLFPNVLGCFSEKSSLW